MKKITKEELGEILRQHKLWLEDKEGGDRADLNAYSIEVGFDLLTAYLRRFAEIAIERNDAELLELCKNLYIISEEQK